MQKKTGIALEPEWGVLLFGLIIMAIAVVWLFAARDQPPGTSPIATPASPLMAQAVGEEFDNLDGEGEIKWYDNLYTWNPRAQVTSYPFITGTVAIHWDDADVGIDPVAVPYSITATNLVVELELRGTETYTQVLDTGIMGELEPGTGSFTSLIWVWIDVGPGVYDEYIKGHWEAGDEIIPLSLVIDGQVVEPVTNFALYREGLTIPHMVYLPVVMK